MCAEYFFRVLDTQVAQTARTVNGNPLSRTHAGNFHAFVSGYAGAGNAGSLRRVEAVGYFDGVVCIDDTVGRHAAVGGVACVQYGTTQGFAAGITVFARTAALEQPCDADAVANFQCIRARSDFFDDTDAFVSQHASRFFAVVACRNVQVGMAHAATFDFNQRLAVFQRAYFAFYNFYITCYILIHNNCLHLHGVLLGIRKKSVNGGTGGIGITPFL